MNYSFWVKKKFYIPAIIIMILGLSLPLFFGKAVAADRTRGISVVAKSAIGGKSQSIALYDYTAALIIGIDRYVNFGIRDQLSFALKDARGMEKVLRENYCFNEIVTLYNEDATRDKIMAALYRFRELSPDAGLLVYFAGHGITMPGLVGGKDLGFLIPSDGSINASEMYKNISMQQIKSDICPQINAKHIFFVFDACFAGLMLDTRATLTEPGRDIAYLQAITQEQVRQVLTAGSKGQTVLDGGPRGHSVFTGRFIEALENTEDYITARELGQKLKKQVYGDAAARGHNQRPVDGEIYGTGDFVFVPDLTKRSRDIRAEVGALEAEMTRLADLKKEAISAKDNGTLRELERQRLIMEAEVKQARIRQQQQEQAVKRRQQAELEAKQQEKEERQQEEEREQRLASLRVQAEKMRQSLGEDMSGGATIESAIAELNQIKSRIDKINSDFTAEQDKQSSGIERFYDQKINRIMDIEPYDKEFETKAEYNARKNKAEALAEPVKKEKDQKIAALKSEIKAARESQVTPLIKQMQTLLDKRFTVPASKVSFKFLYYHLNSQKMKGELKIAGKTLLFNAEIPKEKAREYKKHPDLLVPEVKSKATLSRPEIDKIIFHGPNQDEKYIARPCNSIGMEFVYIEPGTFMMGSPSGESGHESDERQHKITLTRGFYMQSTEVTQGQWKSVMGGNPSKFSNCGDNCPVEQVSWNDCQEFIKGLNLKEGTDKYSLPTEAEWEHAARAGTVTRFCFGDSESGLGQYAWYSENSGGRTHPVAEKQPNFWGLYDMHGNVWEWCGDWKGDYPSYSVIDPEGPSSGSFRVIRGGSWDKGSRLVRCAHRNRLQPDFRNCDIGFRLVRRVE